jgi:hypothetical protein
MLVVLLAGVTLTGCYAETLPATDVTATTAKLRARGHTDSTPAQVYFEYATSAQALGTSAAFTTPRRAVPANVPDTAFSQTVKALLPNTTYHFRVCGRDGGTGGDICNSSRSFTTSSGNPEVSFSPKSFAYTTSQRSNVGQDFATADFNRDGKLDLVTANTDGATVRLGDGTGGFGPPTQAISGYVDDAIGGDLNKDAKPDLITGGAPGGIFGLAVQLGDGAGGFGGVFSRVDRGEGFRDPTLRDLDRDGDLDLAVVVYSSSQAMGDVGGVLLLTADGNGHLAQPFEANFSTIRVWHAQVADVNSDGKLDLVATVNVAPDPFELPDWRLETVLGNGDLTFAAPIVSPNPGAFDMVLGDFDRDGRVDAAVLNAVLKGNGQGGFGSPVPLQAGFQPLLRGDFNRDGIPDLVASGPTSRSVLLGEGDGTFRTPNAYTGGEPKLVADFNRDGRPDILTVVSTGSDGTGFQVDVLLNTAP